MPSLLNKTQQFFKNYFQITELNSTIRKIVLVINKNLVK